MPILRLFLEPNADFTPPNRVYIFQTLDLNAVDSLGKTPLFWSVMHGIPEITRLLIDHGADINKATLPTRSLLHWAAWQGNDEVILCLLESGMY